MTEKLEPSSNFDDYGFDDSGGNSCSPGRYIQEDLNKVIDAVNSLNDRLSEIENRMGKIENVARRLENVIRRECGRIA